jgi:hypothetical protein
MVVTMLTAWFALAPASAAEPEEPARLTWSLSVAGRPVGTRTLSVTPTADGRRRLELITDVNGSVGGVPLSWRQEVTGFAERNPASFHAVTEEDGRPRELQVTWTPGAWTLTTVDRDVRTRDVAPRDLDLSTLDLVDPGSRWRLARYATASVLSVETGDVWRGAVTPLPATTRRVGARDIAVQGVSWKGPDGPLVAWYDGEGTLVAFELRLAGVPLTGVLTAPPPAGRDTFPVSVGMARAEVLDL